ncbi:MAG: sensor domain-containing diguanylate cyclase [Actinomycetia bacterium]|nr:sensor domain-containing diguanylate cyclase [Actinomycetes bacterium]MCH9801609.1 sensor domain-containing diguanylate cyclase [Actinomycetes bacterium]
MTNIRLYAQGTISHEESSRLLELMLAVEMNKLSISDEDLAEEPNPRMQELMAGLIFLDEDLKDRERELKKTQENLETLIDTVSSGVGVCDHDGQIIWANHTATELYPAVQEGERFNSSAIPNPIAAGAYELSLTTPGPTLTITFSETVWGDQESFIFWIHDSSAVEDLRRGAINDPLTSLPNRVLFFDQLAAALESDKRNNQHLAILFMDLNDFKGLNDNHGHLVGDEVLRVVAQRIQSQIRSGDTVARLGGDEFAMVASNTTPAEAAKLAARIVGAVSQPIRVRGLSLEVTISVGVAHADLKDGLNPDEILALADQAMYVEKSRKRPGTP